MIDLSRLEEYTENNRIEAKKALGGLPHSIWETYSAFANTLGGVILLGVEEYRDKSFHTVDLPEPERLVREFRTLVNDPRKVSVNILRDEDVRIETVNGDRIILIQVPRAPRWQKPVYVDGDPVRGSYRRNGEGDHRCTPEELAAMHRDAARRTQDMRILEELGPELLLPSCIRDYRERLGRVRGEHPWLSLGDGELLQRLGALDTDREGGLHPTAAGLLMFSRWETIREVYPGFHLEYRSSGAALCSDAGDWSGNVYDFYFRCLALLRTDLGELGAPPADQALGEALVNSLVNADYHARGGVTVRCLRDRVILENPGDFRVGLETARGGGRSDPRNSCLMRMFGLLGAGEGSGGGIPGIYHTWKSLGRGEPRFRQNSALNRVSLTLPLADDGRGGGPADLPGLRRQLLVDYLTEHMHADLGELSVCLDLHPERTRETVEALLAEDILEEKDGEYRLKA